MKRYENVPFLYADGAGLLSETTMETLKDLPVKNLVVSVPHWLLAV
jgi:hypothetical protein